MAPTADERRFRQLHGQPAHVRPGSQSRRHHRHARRVPRIRLSGAGRIPLSPGNDARPDRLAGPRPIAEGFWGLDGAGGPSSGARKKPAPSLPGLSAADGVQGGQQLGDPPDRAGRSGSGDRNPARRLPHLSGELERADESGGTGPDARLAGSRGMGKDLGGSARRTGGRAVGPDRALRLRLECPRVGPARLRLGAFGSSRR